MSLHVQQGVLDQAMLISAIFIAMWLAKKKSIIIDAIAFILGLFLVACILISFKVF